MHDKREGLKEGRGAKEGLGSILEKKSESLKKEGWGSEAPIPA